MSILRAEHNEQLISVSDVLSYRELLLKQLRIRIITLYKSVKIKIGSEPCCGANSNCDRHAPGYSSCVESIPYFDICYLIFAYQTLSAHMQETSCYILFNN